MKILATNENNPGAAALVIKNALLNGADAITSLDGLVGHGRLNAFGAIENIIPDDLTTLPNSQGNVYNYGVENENLISGYIVNQNGELRVNHVGATRYLDGPNTNMQTYTAQINQSCSDIIINSGGRFVLGNDITAPNDPNSNVTRRAYVHIPTGSTVHVKSGGILRLVRGSQLIIEEGARLIIDDGAEVNLWWSDSKIHVQGELIVNGNFEIQWKWLFPI